MKTFEDYEDFLFECPQCPLNLMGLRRLYLHKRDEHKNTEEAFYKEMKNSTTCIFCNFSTNVRKEMSAHVKTHLNKCPKCELSFAHPYYYSLHVHDAHGDAFNCVLCKQEFKSKNQLGIHVNKKHINKFAFKCHQCNAPFASAAEYKHHIESNHGKGSNYTFECVVCKNSYKTGLLLLKHQEQQHRVITNSTGGLYKCPHGCYKKQFKTEKHYLLHLQEDHTNIPSKAVKKDNLCDICGKAFKGPGALKLHYRMHTGETPFKCSHCDKAFKSHCTLAMHERVHTGEKPYKCRFCDKGFSQHTSRKIHERIHTGEAPFICQFCDKGFKSRTALNGHLKSCSVLKQ